MEIEIQQDETPGVYWVSWEFSEAEMSVPCTMGTRARLRASKRTFRIIATTPETSILKFDDNGEEVGPINDTELRPLIEEIPE